MIDWTHFYQTTNELEFHFSNFQLTWMFSWTINRSQKPYFRLRMNGYWTFEWLECVHVFGNLIELPILASNEMTLNIEHSSIAELNIFGDMVKLKPKWVKLQWKSQTKKL